MSSPIMQLLQRYFFNFNAISLALLAFQNAGYLVLMGYAQKQQDTPPELGSAPRPRLVSSHFLATTEFTKLLISTVWCMYDVLKDMRKDEQSVSLLTVEADREARDASDADRDSPKKGELSPRAAVVACGSPTVSCSVAASLVTPTAPRKTSATVFQDTNPSDDEKGMAKGNVHNPPANAASAESPALNLSELMARKSFWTDFRLRLRHAIGFDEKYKEALLMVVPAVLYTIQGLLLILALQYLDPTVFQILYQVRIMFLAMMMRVVLDFHLSPIRFFALVALMAGIILAQLSMQRKSGAGAKEGDANGGTRASWSLEGTLAALAGAFLSSFSGVFMEFVFKKRGNLFTLSARNIHLAFFSLVYFCLVFTREAAQNADELRSEGKLGHFFSTFFDGFTGLVWFLVVLQAAGGILVALVMRYCDNIVKSFSTAFAIVLSGTASVYLFNLPLEPMFLLGSFLVMASITVYGLKK